MLGQEAQRILLPVETIDIGNLIDLVVELAEFQRQKAAGDVDDGRDDVETGVWDRQDLLDYLRNTTTYQKALLGALVSAGDDWISRKQLVHLMTKVAIILPEAQGHEITGFTIAGARPGLKMRRGDKEDIIEQQDGRYRLKKDYREIVTDWAKTEGLLKPLREKTL